MTPTVTAVSRVRSTLGRVRSPGPLRVLALGAAVLLIGSFVGVLYHVVDVISDPDAFLVIGAVTFLTTTAIARYLSVRGALALAAILLVGGLGWYLAGLDGISLWLWPQIQYTIALLTGLSVLSIGKLEVWVLAVTPAPVFLTWYLAVRRRYVASATAGGATTLFFVLTGDAGPDVALIGAVGVVVLVGVGELDRLGGAVGDADVVATVVALTILVSATVTVVPTGMGYTFSPDTGFGHSETAGDTAGTPDTVEGNLLEAGSELPVVGSLELNSSVRYRVQSSAEEYWRVGAYDLYTGDGWIRQGETDSPDRRLGTSPNRSRTVEQTYRPLSDVRSMPAVWRPTDVSGSAADLARVTELGGLQPSRTLAAGESYHVESAVPVATLSELRNAGRAYPDSIENRYLQLPDSTPDRVAERTDRLTANANNSFDTARVIERWLESNREYSLNVSRPSGDIADAFLFEMDRGYCTYYATTMTAMLRSQDIPARMVVGYSPGQRVSEDEWVVRGNNAHAWVEVYFPDVGWVRFDPTPAGPRESVRNADLETSRENDAPNVDMNDTRDGEWTPEPDTPETSDGGVNDTGGPVRGPADNGINIPEYVTRTPGENGSTTPIEDRTESQTGDEPSGEDGEGGGRFVALPTAEQATLGLLAVLGLAGVVRRTGLGRRAYCAVWVRWQPRSDPSTDVERAFERLSYLLARRHRARGPGETVRTYLDAIDADGRARRVATIRERARYAGTATRADADEAVDLVDELRRE